MVERFAVYLRRPAVVAIVLLLGYGALSFLNDPHGYLGTDTGAKVATLEVMADRGSFDPDVGYWAEQWDPTGHVHPLYDTVKRDGKWINVTTLPMLYSALPLYELGGYRAALLLPMLGSVAAALGAYALAKRLGSSRPWFAMWVVGLASPLVIYAVDFWEHSVGVALILWAGILLYDEVTAERRWWRPLLSGALLGLAFTMRTEALVYIAVFLAAAVLWKLRDRGLLDGLRVGGLAALGLAGVVLANLALELATVGQNMRLSRAGGAAASVGTAGAPVPGSRLEDIMATTLNLNPALDARAYIIGGLSLFVLGGIAFEALRERPDERRLRMLGAVAIALYLFRFIEGFGFVPGLVGAAPVAAAGLFACWRAPRPRAVVALVALALPVVWLFQYRGGAVPQWGGRYELVSGTVLVIVGAVLLEKMPRAVQALFVGLAVAITALGAGWLWQRSHYVGDATAAVAHQPQPVLISTFAHLFREGGWSYGDHLALTAATGDLIQPAADVVERAGYDEFGLITIDTDRYVDLAIAGWSPTTHTLVEFVPDAFLRITTYVRTRP
jgi:hypothetical protein